MKKLERICHLESGLLFWLLQVISGMWAKLAGARSRLQPGNCKTKHKHTLNTHSAENMQKAQKIYAIHTWTQNLGSLHFLFFFFEECQTLFVKSVTDIWIGQETKFAGECLSLHVAWSYLWHFSQKSFSISWNSAHVSDERCRYHTHFQNTNTNT